MKLIPNSVHFFSKITKKPKCCSKNLKHINTTKLYNKLIATETLETNDNNSVASDNNSVTDWSSSSPYGRFPASHTKTWWRDIVELQKSDRKPIKFGRLIKGFQTHAMYVSSPDNCYAPIARAEWPRLAKCIGAKACKKVISWHQAVKRDKMKWPHGYRGRKLHSIIKTNYFSDETDYFSYETDYFSYEEDFIDDYVSVSDISVSDVSVSDVSVSDVSVSDVSVIDVDMSDVIIQNSDSFPNLSSSTNFQKQYETRKNTWLIARATAQDPILNAKKKANDAMVVANKAKADFFYAAEYSRYADELYKNAYNNRFLKSISTWQESKSFAIIARDKADKLAEVMLNAIKIARKREDELYNILRT